MRRTALHLVTALAVALVLVPLPAGAQQKPVAAPPDALDRWNDSIDALMRKVWPSVVQILVTGYGAREDSIRGEIGALEQLCRHGEVMPQKSTFFYPKLATGMVMNPLK